MQNNIEHSYETYDIELPPYAYNERRCNFEESPPTYSETSFHVEQLPPTYETVVGVSIQIDETQPEQNEINQQSKRKFAIRMAVAFSIFLVTCLVICLVIILKIF